MSDDAWRARVREKDARIRDIEAKLREAHAGARQERDRAASAHAAVVAQLRRQERLLEEKAKEVLRLEAALRLAEAKPPVPDVPSCVWDVHVHVRQEKRGVVATAQVRAKPEGVREWLTMGPIVSVVVPDPESGREGVLAAFEEAAANARQACRAAGVPPNATRVAGLTKVVPPDEDARVRERLMRETDRVLRGERRASLGEVVARRARLDGGLVVRARKPPERGVGIVEATSSGAQKAESYGETG